MGRSHVLSGPLFVFPPYRAGGQDGSERTRGPGPASLGCSFIRGDTIWVVARDSMEVQCVARNLVDGLGEVD
jgi:hypothetical protein